MSGLYRQWLFSVRTELRLTVGELVDAGALLSESKAQISHIPPCFSNVSQWEVSQARSRRGKLWEDARSPENSGRGEVQGPCSAALTVGFVLFCRASA